MAILSMEIKDVTEAIGRMTIVESGKMVTELTDTIGIGPEIILETGRKQIDTEKVHGTEEIEIGLENKGLSHNVILNKFPFLFIME